MKPSMKRVVLGMAFLGLIAGSKFAVAQTACPGGLSAVQQVTQLVGNNTMCAVRGNERWQEFHSGSNSGPLIDWKDPSGGQPTEQVGIWSAQNGANGSVTHNYGTGGTYTWTICSAGGASTGPFTLVGTGGQISSVTIRPGQVPCN